LILLTLFHPCIKTLTTLHLSYNEIGHEGAKHIANALQCNKVIYFLLFATPSKRHFIQTLTTLYLSYNRIGDQGVKHLANALRENTVINVLFSLVF